MHDIGLALSPMAYFAQFALDVPCVAMVTASHNENGWTGVKMGAQRPLTFGPDEMGAPEGDRARRPAIELREGGAYDLRRGLRRPLHRRPDRTRPKLKRKLKVVAACGNGTAGAFAPQVLETLGVEVIPLDCRARLHLPALQSQPRRHGDAARHRARRCASTGADVGLGFDGDGDRCGVVDNEGEEIFADKIGVMLARDLSTLHPGATFVVDVKSTGLFATDPVLSANGVKADYWKTGHSYIKRRVDELKRPRRVREVRPLLLQRAGRARL